MSVGLIILSNAQPSFASSIASPSREPSVKFLDMKVSEFVRLSAKEFSTLAGKNMNLKERISFSLLKKDMKKSLKAHPDQLVKNYFATADKKGNTALIIIILVVIVVVAIIIASSAGPGSIGWGE